MAKLREIVEQQGATNVGTYIASGNVVLDSDRTAKALRTSLEHGIAEEFGFPVVVAVLKAAEVVQIVKRNPYKNATQGALHVAFTVTPLAASEREALAKLDVAPEEWAIGRSHVCLHIRGGFAGGPLTRAIDNVIGKRATIRNWRTVETLANMV